MGTEERRVVVVMLVLTVIFWGVAPIFDKAALKGGDPFLGSIVRGLAIAVAMIMALLLSGKVREVAALPAKSILFFVLSGLMAGTLGVFTYLKALQYAPTSKIVPLASTYPLITALLSVLFLGETMTLSRLLGIVCIVAGILLVK